MGRKKQSQKNNSQQEPEEYVVESIIQDKIIKKKKYFLVKWEGYPESENTWEPEGNLIAGCGDLLKQYQLNKKLNSSAKKNQKNEKLINKQNIKNKKLYDEQSEDQEEQSSQQYESNVVKDKIQNFAQNINKEQVYSQEKDFLVDEVKRISKTQEIQNLQEIREGKFELGDVPLKIIRAVKQYDDINMVIQWKYDKTQTFVPKNSTFTNHHIKKFDKDLIINYYESKITFRSNQTSSNQQSAQKQNETESSSNKNDENDNKKDNICQQNDLKSQQNDSNSIQNDTAENKQQNENLKAANDQNGTEQNNLIEDTINKHKNQEQDQQKIQEQKENSTNQENNEGQKDQVKE
ncbi:Chromo domain protein [Pseudocohnilembus persalinus]|uniref:Chromo domain protein n=1 Tax=Pseudocohnilembus persalinus TaxID=266149 RepID=A0A0V0QL31_PSEPJ|nr:Chromo domain protein [Pseudocohnilembus persalinus]|eukprot:KRX02661.1 Chromo domain protein [Pseudocohnilembus persalinus]